jgi:AcrR family transcriptional regulator
MSHSPDNNCEPRWRRLPEQRPSQIMDAALEVFGEHGLAATRLEDIAKRAGLSKGTIYLYFPNKEELFREMIRHTVVAQIERREQLMNDPSSSSTELIVRFMREHWKFTRSAQFAPLFRLIHVEIQNFPDLATFYAEEVIGRSHRLLTSIIARGVETGEFRKVDPLVASRMLSGALVIHGLWCTHRKSFAPLADRTDDQVLDELIQFYLHAIQAPDVPQSAQSAAPNESGFTQS